MSRATWLFVLVLSVSQVGATARAQSAALTPTVAGYGPLSLFTIGFLNDLQLAGEPDIAYIYADPSPGFPVGVPTPLPPFPILNDMVFKVYPKETLRHCNGVMNVTGLVIYTFDTDYTTTEGSGFNTSLHDLVLSPGVASGCNIGQIEPSGLGPTISFGLGTPNNNAFLTDPGCPVAGSINGYKLDIQLFPAIPITANGATDWTLLDIIPGGMSGPTSGGGACLIGDYTTQAGYSQSETQVFPAVPFFSAFSGTYAAPVGACSITDPVNETPFATLQFAEPIVAMRMNSNTGNGVEEGLNGVHYDCPPNVGGTLGARLYALQGANRPDIILGTISPPLVSCINFKGTKLGLNPTDPLFNLFASLWLGTVIITDNGGPPTGMSADDGTWTPVNLPLKAQIIPVSATVSLWFQGFCIRQNGSLEGSQITQLILHG